MLTFPLHFERCLKATAVQLHEPAVLGRSWRHGRVCRASGVLGRKVCNQRRSLLGEEALVEARETGCAVVNHSSRVKRSWSLRRCKPWLNQPKKGIARGASPPGLLLVHVSCTTTTPALEKKDRVLSPAGIQDEEMFLSALVACTPLKVSNDTHDILVRNDHEGEKGRVANNRREETRRETKDVTSRKQKWRLDVEGVRVYPEIQPKKVNWVSNSDHHRLELEEMVLLLESVDVDTAKVFSVCPSMVNTTVDKLKAVMNHLESCGLKRKDLGRMLSMTPQILELSVIDNLRPAVRFLLDEVGLRKIDLRKVINRCPRLLVASVDSQLRPTMHYLQSLGFTRMASLVSNNATLLTFGIQSKLIPKLEFLQTLGMSRADVVRMVLRFPAIFNYGVEQNLRPKYEYLVNVMGRDVDHLKAFPQYFGYSLDYRIRPRYEFLVQRSIKVSLPNFLKLSDEEFHNRFKGSGSRVEEIGKERKSPVVVKTPVNKCDEKLTIAAIKEEANHRRIPVHIGL